MSSSQSVRTALRVAVATLAVGAAVLGLTVAQSDGPGDYVGSGAFAVEPGRSSAQIPRALRAHDEPGRQELKRPALGESGRVPDHVTVFHDQIPAVAKLDPALLTALRRAATDAAHDRVEIQVTSGWRSAEYQAQLLREAIAEYGSAEQAARWVATPETSAHVSGDAVDIGPSKAENWLAAHGAVYGLCQIYRNEPWHYELRPDAVVDGCPPLYADPSHDPRMQ